MARGSAFSYTADAILSCVELALSPAEHTLTVRERVDYTRAELMRSISLTIIPPSGVSRPLGTAELGDPALGIAQLRDEAQNDEDEDAAEEPLLFPILTPHKNLLITVTDSLDGDDKKLIPLSHAEHSHVSRLMISELLWMAGAYWLTVDFDNARHELLELQRRLHGIVELSPEEADRELHGDAQGHEGIFDSRGLLTAIPLETRSRHETSLYLLCKVLADRYLFLLEGQGVLGQRMQVRYTHRTPYSRARHSWRGRLAEHLGGTVTNLRIPAPLARRTDDYHFFMEAEPGYYFYRQSAFTKPSPTRLNGTARPEEATDGTANSVSASGSVSEAHIYVSHGSTLRRHRVDVNVTTFEAPLGSVAPAWAVTAITTATLTLMLILRWASGNELTASNIPALLVSLVTTTAAIAGQAFHGRRNVPPSLLGRVSVMMAVLCGNAFAVWLLFVSTSQAIGGFGDKWVVGIPIKIFEKFGGVAITAAAVLLLIWLTWRAVRVVKSFARVVYNE